MKPTVKLDRSLVALEREDTVNVMLELVSPPEATTRAPLALALVLDRSGSMGGPKLATAKACAGWLASMLRPDDELALVTFDDEVELRAALAPVGPQHAAALAGVRSGGSTNLSGGWLKGLEQLRPVDGGRRRSILLLTDGLANVGIVAPAPLVELARGAGASGVATSTIGYGDGFDEDLLTAMADAGGGNAHYAPTPDAAPEIFRAEFDALSTLVAQNVSVEIRPGPQVELVEVLNDLPATPVAGGLQLALGDAYAGERRRLVLALRVPGMDVLGPATVAELVLRSVSVGDSVVAHEERLPVVVNVVSAREAAAVAPDEDVRSEVLLLAAARAREEAIELLDDGRADEASARLSASAGTLRASGQAAQAALLDESARTLDRKQLRYQSRNLNRGRS